VERRDRKALERAAPALHWLLHLQARHGEAMELFYRAEEAFKSVASTGDGRYILAIMPLYRVFFRPGRLVAARYPPVDIEATLALWETLDERPEHGLPLSRAMLGLANHGADPGRIAAVARKSLSFSERHGDRSGEAIALSTLATVSFAYYGDFDEAERLLQTALTIDLQIGFHLNARWVEDLLGTIAQLRGRYVEARDHFDACLVHHRAGNIAQMLDTHLFQLGELELELGNHASAMQHFAESLAVAERLQHAAQAASVLAGYGLEAAYRGDASAAAAFYAQSRACLNDHGIEVVEDTVDVLNVGLLALLLDDFAEARALFEAITQDAIARRDRVLMMRCYCRLGHALVGLDEQERARHALFGALHDATTFGADAVTLETLVGIAQLDCLPPDDAVALLSFVQSQAAANRYSRRLAGRCLARLAPEAGDAAANGGGALTFEAALALVAPFGFEVGADQQAANRDLVEPLSARELDVLVLIAEGLTNREIADRLFVGVSTIKKHINHIYGKLDVADRDGVLNRARALRLLP
jgi:LuxR family maltose regulon positive regulatory protein